MSTFISQIGAAQVGQTVTLNGWVNHMRSSGKVAFVQLRDGTGYIQCVAEEKIMPDTFAVFAGLNIESSLRIT